MVWIVVPVFDRFDAISSLRRQLLSQSFQDFRLIVIDHGTTPIDRSSFEDSRTVVLRGSPDLWWTGAVNMGIRYVIRHGASQDDLVLVINDDVTIGNEYLPSLVQIARDHPRTLVGSVCVDRRTNRIVYAGLSLSRWRAKFVPRHAGRQPETLPESLIPSDILPGRGVMIPLAAFTSVGTFDQNRLPHYGADDEFSWRARKAGFNLVVGSRCVVATMPRDPPVLGAATTFNDFIADKKKSGNMPAVKAFSALCFGGPYARYYTGVQLLRYVLSYVKRLLMWSCTTGRS